MKTKIFTIGNNLLVALLSLLAGLVLPGCGNESFETLHPESTVKVNPDGTFTLEGTIVMPVMHRVNSRAFGNTPGEGMMLTLIEFDYSSDSAEGNAYSNCYEAEITSSTAVDNGELVNYKVTLTASSDAKVLHFIVADHFLTEEVKALGVGSAAYIIPHLAVGNTNAEDPDDETGYGEQAFWGRRQFPDGYSYLDDEDKVKVLPEAENLLKNVPVIRNFAQINVTVAENVHNFTLLGFDMVNLPTAGTIAPYMWTGENMENFNIPDLLGGDGKTMKSFEEISYALGYHGVTPSGVYLRNKEVDAKMWTAGNHERFMQGNPIAPVYMYERPYQSLNRSYLIIYGRYIGDDGSVTDGFYKLDIGNPTQGTFDYYNILRNINYVVNITAVTAPGMETVADAITHVPFNNLLASTEISSMPSISDGINMLEVNDTNHIIVDSSQLVEILYRYVKDFSEDSETTDNDVPTIVGLQDAAGNVVGPVVRSFTTEEVTLNNEKWVRLLITPNDPTSVVQTQEFSIVDGNGLGRTIHLILRQPWQYATLPNTDGLQITVAPGADNMYDGFQAPATISNKPGAELTVYFSLPSDMPESMFPLQFQLEALRQGIENNKIGSLSVATGPSLFPGQQDKVAISYIKTVSYEEYMYQYLNDGSNNVNVNRPNSNHIVRCRFLTTLEDTSDDCEILVHNEYFTPDVIVKFSRE